MSIYPFLVLAHILGSFGIGAAMAIEAVSLARLARAPTLSEARAWPELFVLSLRLGVGAMLTTFASGVWMMVSAWGPRPWLVASVIGLVGMAMLGALLSLRQVRQLRSASDPGALASSTLAAGFRSRTAIAIAIVAIMTFKPEAVGSALILSFGAVAGLLSHFALRALTPSVTTASDAP